MKFSANYRAAKAAAERALKGDPRSYFYGDPVIDIDPQDVSETPTATGLTPAEAVIVEEAPTTVEAASRLTAYNQLTPEQRAAATMLPPLAVWNAKTIINPLLGKIPAFNLNYNLTKMLCEMPFKGETFSAVATASGSDYVASVTISTTEQATYAVPLFSFVVANSTLNTPMGGIVTISFQGTDASGFTMDTITASSEYRYTFQRMATTQAVRGIFIPFRVMATRTLPFMPIFSGTGSATSQTITVTFSGLVQSDTVYINVLGYAAEELSEIAEMYNLPAGHMVS